MTDRALGSDAAAADTSREPEDRSAGRTRPQEATQRPSARDIADAIVRRVVAETLR